MPADAGADAGAAGETQEARPTMAADSDWVDPNSVQGPAIVPSGRMDNEGWLSTARVGRDAGLAGTLVMAGTELVKSAGWVSPETLASMPYTMVVATGLATIAVRFAWKWLGKYVA